jgi:tRNA-2-methylthio-N6-dimethylallyladenosine synthase
MSILQEMVPLACAVFRGASIIEEKGRIVLHFKMKKRVYIYTYGCQMNVHDSEKMLGLLAEGGYTPAAEPEEADLIVFNTCAIREKAEQKFYSQLGRTKLLKRRNRDLKIAVAGCVAQESREGITRRAPFVDFLLGPQNIDKIRDIVSGQEVCASFEDNIDISLAPAKALRGDRFRAWVSIMYGCNNFCSYCIVPYTRGREISRPSSSIVAEVRGLADKGYREVTLLGQNVNSYRSDIDFAALLKKIDAVGIGRVRFVTSHPRDISLEVIRAMAELPSVCEHIHLPIQSGSDRILALMNRGYTYGKYIEKIHFLREAMPAVSITTDVIAGFPGETGEDHQATLRALSEIEFDGIFAFKYSPRRGTKAFEMGGHLPEEVRGERLNVILKVQEGITQKKNRGLEGSIQEILIEGKSETNHDLLSGRTRTNKIVTIPDSGEREGDLVRVRVERARLHSLEGLNLATAKASCG